MNRFAITTESGIRYPYECSLTLEELSSEVAKSDILVLNSKIALMCKKVISIEILN